MKTLQRAITSSIPTPATPRKTTTIRWRKANRSVFRPVEIQDRRLAKGDVVFVPIWRWHRGYCEADGKLVKALYQGQSGTPDEGILHETAALRARFAIRSLLPKSRRSLASTRVFMGTMFGVDADGGKAIRKFIHDHRQLVNTRQRSNALEVGAISGLPLAAVDFQCRCALAGLCVAKSAVWIFRELFMGRS